jgi:hypothetical protein
MNSGDFQLDAAYRDYKAAESKYLGLLGKKKREQHEACSHMWSYVGQGHNDDMYMCHKCGLSKWE